MTHCATYLNSGPSWFHFLRNGGGAACSGLGLPSAKDDVEWGGDGVGIRVGIGVGMERGSEGPQNPLRRTVRETLDEPNSRLSVG